MIADDTATNDPRDPPDNGAGRETGGADTMESKYRIDRVIASGGMGVVVAATHRHLGTRVAIKLLHEASEDMRQRFLREAKLAARFDSPYVARVRDYGFTADGQPFLVMDHLDGRTLKARIDAGPEAQAEVLRLAREIVAALVEVHRARIVHRDIKPSNIFLVRDEAGIEHVKLIDFGIAKRISGDDGGTSEAGITRTGEILGTVSYMAAEQMRGSTEVDQRADIFSVGAVLYEMLTGHRAFDSASRGYALAMSSGKEDVAFTPLGSLVPGLDPVLEEVVSRCLAFDRAARFQSAAALLSALPAELAITGKTSTVAVVSSSAETATPKLRKWPWIMAAIAVGMGGTVALIGVRAPPAPAAPAALATVLVSAAASGPTVAPAPTPLVAVSSPSASASAESAPPARPHTYVRPPKATAAPRPDERH